MAAAPRCSITTKVRHIMHTRARMLGTAVFVLLLGFATASAMGTEETATEEAVTEGAASREAVQEPKPPTVRVEWRDGKTRVTTKQAYLEISNRVQVRFT